MLFRSHHLHTSPGMPSGPGDLAGGRRLRQGASSAVEMVGEPAAVAEAEVRGNNTTNDPSEFLVILSHCCKQILHIHQAYQVLIYSDFTIWPSESLVLLLHCS